MRVEVTKQVTRISFVFALLCLLSSAAHAEDRARARAAFERGNQHYTLGEYREALDAFKEAYRNFGDPSFLFNIAQCHRQLDQNADAIRSYKMYLLNAPPDAGNREDVKELIAKLEKTLNEQRATKNAPPGNIQGPRVELPAASTTPSPSNDGATLTASAPPPKKTPTYKKWWVWTLVGVAVAGGAAAGIAVGVTRGNSAPTATTSFGTVSPF
jgi:tetratricopeptide (TPR) repeat protein